MIKVMKCPFCNIDKTKLENTILEETQYFYILPALGSLVDGYVLIVSKRHTSSMSELTTDEMKEYVNLIDKYREIFQSIYHKYPIVFEHGSPLIEGKLKANSVEHAHTHIVNHHYKNENELLRKENFKRISKITKIGNNKNYILYINPSGENYITYDFKSTSQLMRIEIARDLNLLDMYDWHQNYFQNNIIATVDKILFKPHN